MDGGSGLNILNASTLDRMGIQRGSLSPSTEPFFMIIPGVQATPLGSIQRPVTFGGPSNFRKEVLALVVVDFLGPYHALFVWPCYAKFMAVTHYGCLKVKMPGPWEVITVASPPSAADFT